MSKWQDHGVEDPTQVDLAVVIGRFQPVHNGHAKLFEKARQISNNVLTLVGSSFVARTIKNPFTYDERREMIEYLYSPKTDLKCWTSIKPIVDDLYNDQRWVGEIQAAIEQELEILGLNPNTARIAIVGHMKDDSSYYLSMFPKYRLVTIDNHDNIDGTTIRNLLFGKNLSITMVPKIVEKYLRNWIFGKFGEEVNHVYEDLRQERQFLIDYKSQFAGLKFPPVFVTADAVVINNGHILLVKRRSHPGKGLWALPGGFLNQEERIEDAILRELQEETRIKVSPLVLKAALKGTHVFDSPYRSLRGRTITHAGLIVLNMPTLPTVRGSDDAEKAKWFPISEFYNMGDQLFEDHHSIGQYMINRA